MSASHDLRIEAEPTAQRGPGLSPGTRKSENERWGKLGRRTAQRELPVVGSTGAATRQNRPVRVWPFGDGPSTFCGGTNGMGSRCITPVRLLKRKRRIGAADTFLKSSRLRGASERETEKEKEKVEKEGGRVLQKPGSLPVRYYGPHFAPLRRTRVSALTICRRQSARAPAVP
jgi:hypothetical protein